MRDNQGRTPLDIANIQLAELRANGSDEEDEEFQTVLAMRDQLVY
jgi:hypothetical protein